MLNVLDITAPLFTLILLGYLAVKSGLLPDSLLGGIARFVLYFCVPGVILSNFLREQAQPVLLPEFLKIYAIAGVATLALGYLVGLLLLRATTAASSIYALGGAIPNSMFVGFPVLMQVMPDIAVQVLVMCVLVENALIMPIALLLADISAAKATSLPKRIYQIAKRIAVNPMLIAVAVGLTLSSFDIYAPSFMQISLDMLAKAAAPAALVFIGGSLVGNSIRGDIGPVLSTSTIKLVAMPLLVMLTLYLSAPIPDNLATALILVSASPMLSIYAILASGYGVGKTAASILVVTTAASFFTLNAFLAHLLQ